MKKLILLCVAFFCLQVVGAQEAKPQEKIKPLATKPKN
jgi:hypothetical protein